METEECEKVNNMEQGDVEDSGESPMSRYVVIGLAETNDVSENSDTSKESTKVL